MKLMFFTLLNAMLMRMDLRIEDFLVYVEEGERREEGISAGGDLYIHANAMGIGV